jgi:hypothetical protein
LTAKDEQISTLHLTPKSQEIVLEMMTPNFLTLKANLNGNGGQIDQPSTNRKAETMERATPSPAKPIRRTPKSRATAAQNPTPRTHPNGDANSRNQNSWKQEMQKTMKTKQNTI